MYRKRHKLNKLRKVCACTDHSYHQHCNASVMLYTTLIKDVSRTYLAHLIHQLMRHQKQTRTEHKCKYVRPLSTQKTWPQYTTKLSTTFLNTILSNYISVVIKEQQKCIARHHEGHLASGHKMFCTLTPHDQDNNQANPSLSAK